MAETAEVPGLPLATERLERERARAWLFREAGEVGPADEVVEGRR